MRRRPFILTVSGEWICLFLATRWPGACVYNTYYVVVPFHQSPQEEHTTQLLAYNTKLRMHTYTTWGFQGSSSIQIYTVNPLTFLTPTSFWILLQPNWGLQAIVQSLPTFTKWRQKESSCGLLIFVFLNYLRDGGVCMFSLCVHGSLQVNWLPPTAPKHFRVIDDWNWL